MKTKLIALLCLSLIAAAPLVAGTPLICFPFEIGQARSLPGGSDGPHGTTLKYDRANLVADTMSLLTPEMPTLVRMETLRRAAIYAVHGEMFAKSYTADDRRLVMGIVDQLRARAKAGGTPGAGEGFDLGYAKDAAGAQARFDLGYFAETLRHAGYDTGIDGYTLIVQETKIRAAAPTLEFALALVASFPKRPEFDGHLARARAGAKGNALLAENLDSHFPKS